MTPFTFSRGDEIQTVLSGALSSPDSSGNYVLLPTLAARIGIGTGRITSGLTTTNSWEMNGPAFHRARQPLDETKQSRHWRTRLVSGDPGLDQITNTIFTLYDAIQSRWTVPQWEGVMLYEATGSYQEAAKSLGWPSKMWRNVAALPVGGLYAKRKPPFPCSLPSMPTLTSYWVNHPNSPL